MLYWLQYTTISPDRLMSDENHGITPEGQAKLGAFVSRTRSSAEISDRVVAWLKQYNPVETPAYPTSQEQFARWVSAMSGVFVSESAIGRLERGEGRTGPPIGVLIALCKYMKILRLPNGRYCTMNDASDILCGELDPLVPEEEDSTPGNTARKGRKRMG